MTFVPWQDALDAWIEDGTQMTEDDNETTKEHNNGN